MLGIVATSRQGQGEQGGWVFWACLAGATTKQGKKLEGEVGRARVLSPETQFMVLLPTYAHGMTSALQRAVA